MAPYNSLRFTEVIPIEFSLHEMNRLGGNLDLQGEVSIAERVAGEKQIVDTPPVHAQLHAHREKGQIPVDGTLTGEVTFLCSRCLDRFRYVYTLPYQESFVQSHEPVLSGEEDAKGRYLFSGDTVRLDDSIADLVLVQLPLIPLCQPDCKGLCPVCGTNRNRHSCECSTERLDPRWEVLKELQWGDG